MRHKAAEFRSDALDEHLIINRFVSHKAALRSERLFGGYPELAYVEPLRQGNLPPNIRVSEFYFQPGSFVNSPLAQQQYVSSNYTHVVRDRDIVDAGINVLAQLVAKSADDGGTLSLSCNPDLTLDLAPRLRDAANRGDKVALLAQVNRNLPFMYGDAVVSPDYFDAVVDDPKYDFPLFGPPNQSVSTIDYLIALHVSALIRDGGTLQLGIGSLGDAVTYLLKLRHEDNETYRRVLSDAGILDQFGDVIERVGGTGRFERGLYASTEMLVHGFLELYRCGVLKRRVHDAAIQRRVETGGAREQVRGTHIAHACFFLGPQRFYDDLRRMDRSEREQFCMTGIAFVNQLYGQEELKRLQRKEARFVNTGLVVTLSGAVSSDALEDGRVVSGVGGQYNFVTMAHALEDGRSILLIRGTRDERGVAHSNIRVTYRNLTIPRHLRDIIVTEYGIADLRGRTDEEVAMALIRIADSRFQKQLLREVQEAGKIGKHIHVPDGPLNNRLERMDAILAPYRARGLFPAFPFGTDLTGEEVVLKKALDHLKQTIERERLVRPRPHVFRKMIDVPESARPYLERMRLDAPRTLKEHFLRRVVIYGLASVDAI